MPKTEYEQIWGKPIEQGSYNECPSCKSDKIIRHFCGEYICDNCGKNFGECNLWNTTPDPYTLTKKKKKSED